MKKNICMKKNIYTFGLIATVATVSLNTTFANTVQTNNTIDITDSIEVITTTEEVIFNPLEGVIRTTTDDLFSNRDFKINYNDDKTYSVINLVDGGTIATDGVTVNNDIITITKEGTYELNGALSNGQIIINCDKADKVQLVLKGVTINNNTSAPIYVEQADKVFITTLENTVNTLTSTIPEEDETGIDAVIFSREDMTLNGAGILNLIGINANGITSKDELRFTSGIYNVTADKHAIEANDAVKIADGEFNLTAKKDGLHANNSDDDTLGFIHIFGGDFIIKAEDDGIESNGYLTIDDGDFNIDVLDDALHTNSDLTIFGGNFEISSVDDAIHADVKVTIYDGEINIITSYEGIEGQMIDIHGGNINMYCNDDGINATIKSDEATSQFGHGIGQQSMMVMPNIENMTEEDIAIMMAEMKELKQNNNTLMQEGMQTPTGQVMQEGMQTPNGQVMQGGIQTPNGQVMQGGIQTPNGQVMQGGMQTPNGQVIQEGIQTPNGQQNIQLAEAPTIELTNINKVVVNEEVAEGENIIDNRIYINITGGNIYINSNLEGDGLDSNGDITISGGNLYISSTTDIRDTALDYNNNGIISGGSVIAAGSASKTVQNFSTDSTQASIVVVLDSLVNFENIAEDTSVGFTLSDQDGNIVVDFTPDKDYQAILISTPELIVGNVYTLTTPLGIKTIKLDSNLYAEGTSIGGNMGNMNNISMNGQKVR